MGRVKEWAFDEAEDIIDDNIKKVKNGIITESEAVEIVKENSLVKTFFNNDEIELMIEHDLEY